MKKIGTNIGEEVGIHNKLLDNLDQGVDKNIKGMNKATGSVEKILEKSSSC